METPNKPLNKNLDSDFAMNTKIIKKTLFSQFSNVVLVAETTTIKVFEIEEDQLCNIYEEEISPMLNAIYTELISPDKFAFCDIRTLNQLCILNTNKTSFYDIPIEPSMLFFEVKYLHEVVLVCYENRIEIFKIPEKDLQRTISDLKLDSKELIALGLNRFVYYVAYPSPEIGSVSLLNMTKNEVYNFEAHQEPLVAIALNESCKMIATASKEGTCIRVFDVINKCKMHDLIRGVTRVVAICSLSFSEDSKFLCTSSNTETVHIFKINVEEIPKSIKQAATEGLKNLALKVCPSKVYNYCKQERAFANVYLPQFGIKHSCKIVYMDFEPKLIVVTEEGDIFIFKLDLVKGGNGSLEKSYRYSNGEFSKVKNPLVSMFLGSYGAMHRSVMDWYKS